jgi:hypothetical protein
MDEFMPTVQGRHVYKLKWWAQLWYLTWGVFASGIGLVFIVSQIASGDWDGFVGWRAILLSVFFPALGYFFLALALRSRVELDATTISVRGALQEKSANLCDVEGYRISTTRYASFWRFELKGDRGNISVMRSFDVDDDFRALLSHLKNLEEDFEKLFTLPR